MNKMPIIAVKTDERGQYLLTADGDKLRIDQRRDAFSRGDKIMLIPDRDIQVIAPGG